jgi:hypothetical protein
MNFSVTQNGKPLDPSKYHWDEASKTFSTTENNLVLDFSGWDEVTFNTGCDCTFTTGSGCIFTTGSGCIFTTGCDCTFTTSSDCTFNTGCGCTFTACGENCFITRWDVKGVTEVPENTTIKLNGLKVAGYTEVPPIHTITIDAPLMVRKLNSQKNHSKL